MKKIFSSKKRVAAIGVITAATMVGGGMAVAYWTSSGTDTDTATVGTSSLFAVKIIPVTTAALSPGGPTNTYSVQVTNPGSGVQRWACCSPAPSMHWRRHRPWPTPS